MVIISRKVDYAILALFHLAKTESASARELAGAYQLSRPFVANILKALCQAGFVLSQRGVRGGYRLARPAKEITLSQVIAALDGPFQLMSCAEDDNEDACRLNSMCPIKGPLRAIHARLIELLGSVTVEDLMVQPELVTISMGYQEPATATLPPCTGD